MGLGEFARLEGQDAANLYSETMAVAGGTARARDLARRRRAAAPLFLLCHPPGFGPRLKAVSSIDIPECLVWDYAEAPDDLLWRLQRIADWFPAFGRDRRTVSLLFAHRAELRLEPEIRELIEMYEEAWREKELAREPR